MKPKTSAPKLTGINVVINTDYNVKVVPQTICNVIRNTRYKDCVSRNNLLSFK